MESEVKDQDMEGMQVKEEQRISSQAEAALLVALSSGVYISLRLHDHRLDDLNFFKKELAPDNVKKYKKVIEIVRNIFREKGLKVFDIEHLTKEAISELYSLIEKQGCLSDKSFFVWIHETTKNFGENKKQAIFEVALKVAELDGKLQDAEIDVLDGLRSALNISSVDFQNIIKKSKRMAWAKRIKIASLFILFIVISISLIFGYREYKEFTKLPQTALEAHQLIFSTVDFSRYVLVGNATNNQKLKKAFIGHIKGKAEIYTDFNAIKLECKPKGIKEFYLYVINNKNDDIKCKAIFDMKKVTGNMLNSNQNRVKFNNLPMFVRLVESSWKDIEEVYPKPIQINKEKANNLAKKFAVITGLATTGIMLAKTSTPDKGESLLHGLIGRWVPSIGKFTNLAVTGVKAVTAGAATGGVVYVATKGALSFIDGMQLTDNISQQQKEKLKQYAVNTTLSELAFDPELNRWYQKAISNSVYRMYKRMGIEIVNKDNMEIRF